MTLVTASSLLVDTHELVEQLIEEGFSKEQAEGVTNAIKSIDLSHLATKQDILEIKQDMKELEYRMTIKIGAIVIGALAFFRVMEGFFANM